MGSVGWPHVKALGFRRPGPGFLFDRCQAELGEVYQFKLALDLEAKQKALGVNLPNLFAAGCSYVYKSITP
jgi:hypothetical protein